MRIRIHSVTFQKVRFIEKFSQGLKRNPQTEIHGKHQFRRLAVIPFTYQPFKRIEVLLVIGSTIDPRPECVLLVFYGHGKRANLTPCRAKTYTEKRKPIETVFMYLLTPVALFHTITHKEGDIVTGP